MFAEIRKLLEARGKLSLRELATHFTMSPPAIEPMLDLLVRKGRICMEKVDCGSSCSGCTSACPADRIYWPSGPDIRRG